MQKFNSKKYLEELASELVYSFDKAKIATTPGAKGSVREGLVKRKLENILPAGVGVGSGYVIDHIGGVSKQQDIILYEKNICPIFSISNTPGVTYYPCEGVIAVGEIKTNIGRKEIEDSFSKIESVKNLKRNTIRRKNLSNEKVFSFRSYLSVNTLVGTKKEEFNQSKNFTDQIYGFILCYDFSIKSIDKISKHIYEASKIRGFRNLPNVLVTLKSGILHPFNTETNQLCLSADIAGNYLYGYRNCDRSNFGYLIARLYQIIRVGRSVDVSAFEHYIVEDIQEMTLEHESIISLI